MGFKIIFYTLKISPLNRVVVYSVNHILLRWYFGVLKRSAGVSEANMPPAYWMVVSCRLLTFLIGGGVTQLFK